MRWGSSCPRQPGGKFCCEIQTGFTISRMVYVLAEVSGKSSEKFNRGEVLPCQCIILLFVRIDNCVFHDHSSLIDVGRIID